MKYLNWLFLKDYYQLFFLFSLDSKNISVISKILLFMNIKILYNLKLNFDLLNYIIIFERLTGSKPFIKKVFFLKNNKIKNFKRNKKNKFYNINFLLCSSLTKSFIYMYLNFLFYFIHSYSLIKLFYHIKFSIFSTSFNSKTNYILLKIVNIYFFFNFLSFKYLENRLQGSHSLLVYLFFETNHLLIVKKWSYLNLFKNLFLKVTKYA